MATWTMVRTELTLPLRAPLPPWLHALGSDALGYCDPGRYGRPHMENPVGLLYETPLGSHSSTSTPLLSSRCPRDTCSRSGRSRQPAYLTRQGILPLRMPFSRDESRRHERTRPERRALVALGSSTVKHNSYRRRKAPRPTQIQRFPGQAYYPTAGLVSSPSGLAVKPDSRPSGGVSL
jgi:hypothetical protein